jgi:hypothetical protein
MSERDDLPDVPSLATLEPPAGGLEELRTRLDAAPRRSMRLWLALPAAALAAVALWLALRREAAPVAPAPSHSAELVADPAIAPRFYWVASTPSPRVRPATLSSAGAPPPIVAFVAALPR